MIDGLFHLRLPVEMRHADERMQRFEAVEVVECLYRVKLDFLHGLTIFKMSSAIWSSSSRLSESSC